jgi:hypothetical protein
VTEAGEFAYYVASAAVGLGLTLGPIGQAVARRLTAKWADKQAGPMAAERIEVLEARLQELEQCATRMTELEERLDFAERMLAQLPPGSAAGLDPGVPDRAPIR